MPVNCSGPGQEYFHELDCLGKYATAVAGLRYHRQTISHAIYSRIKVPTAW